MELTLEETTATQTATQATEMQQELALKVLKHFNVIPDVTNGLKKGVKYYSERQNSIFNAVLYWMDNKPEWVQQIKKLEEEYGIYVYHACHYYTTYGEILDCLYIPSPQTIAEDPDYIQMLKEELKEGIVPVYAINFDEPLYSEFGSGQYKGSIGGITKLA